MNKRHSSLLAAACLCAGLSAQAQLVKPAKKVTRQQWHLLSVEKDSVYGAAINEAHAFLKNKKVKKKPIVAIIGSGMDIAHEDLKAALWTNPAEKADGKDNDKNGLVDDIHGWNYLGNTKGEVVDHIRTEGDREFFRLKDKYLGLFFDGQHYYRYNDQLETLMEVAAPQDPAEYMYYMGAVSAESELARTSNGREALKFILYYAKQFDQELKARFPGVSPLTTKEFATLYDPKAPHDSLRDVSFVMMNTGFGFTKNPTWESVYQSMRTGSVKLAEQNIQRLTTQHPDTRVIIGDDPLQLKDSRYGNNTLLAEGAGPGTMSAGVIGAVRNNQLGMDGIADAALMPLRVYASSGEPYLKDMALAIRYAADHGADVIVLGAPNTLFPAAQGQWVYDALAYAATKEVLVVSPVWDLGYDLAQQPFYPNRHQPGGTDLSNFMMVAASNQQGLPLTDCNFGKEELDLFAPGTDIYTTFIGDSYRTGTGSMMAAATVAGTAALLRAYYPSLKAAQLRSLLMEQVTSRVGTEVEKGVQIKTAKGFNKTKDLYLFEDLCTSGGILNASKAVIAADKLSQQKK